MCVPGVGGFDGLMEGRWPSLDVEVDGCKLYQNYKTPNLAVINKNEVDNDWRFNDAKKTSLLNIL